MTTLAPTRWKSLAAPTGGILVLISLASVAWLTAARWWPVVADRLGLSPAAAVVQPAAGDHPPDEHAEHVLISPQAQKNIGLVLGQIERRDFDRSITLPAMLAEQPGRSHIAVTTHFTGIVTKLYVSQGQAISAGQPLFDLRLTHEELIQSQTDLLKTAQEIELLDREIARIEELVRRGGIAGKTLLDRQYERERHQAAMVAQRQALLLHEMTEVQIAQVLKTKELLGTLTISALGDEGMVDNPASIVLLVHELKVTLGQHIMAGDTLALLSDHSRLLVEGEAFEQDAPALTRAMKEGWPLALLPVQSGGPQRPQPADPTEPPEQVKVLYLADTIDPATRTFHFYAELANRLVHDASGPDGRRYVQWKHRPGERLRVQAPVERWPARLVVPLSAIAQDGVETYVFRYVADEFVRTGVHVEYRDEQFAVLADDKSVREGQIIAMTAAQQVQFALANQSGAGAAEHHHDH